MATVHPELTLLDTACCQVEEDLAQTSSHGLGGSIAMHATTLEPDADEHPSGHATGSRSGGVPALSGSRSSIRLQEGHPGNTCAVDLRAAGTPDWDSPELEALIALAEKLAAILEADRQAVA